MSRSRKIVPSETFTFNAPTLVLAAILFLSLASAAFADPLRIGVIGDQTFSTDIQASYNIMQQGVSILSAQPPLDVVLHTGDLIESTLPPDQVTALWQQATGILNHLPVTWYLTPGDHDVDPPVFKQDSSDRSREQLFQQLYGQRVPEVLQHPYYSFDVNGFHFVALYSEQTLHTDPRFGNIFLARVYDDQFSWLQQDLAAHANAKRIIVFLHQPLWYHWSGWERVHRLLSKYPVAAVVAGHFHYNQDERTVDNIRYIVVGATGGFTKVGSRNAGDVHHVSVLTVGTTGPVQVQLLPVTDNLPLMLQPRVDMDRIQALDVQLGNFFDFSQINPVFVKNGQLVSDCTSGNPAQIQITEIGDPTDLPLDVKINFSSSPGGVSLASPHFPAGQCSTVVSGTECVLARTARTFISNYSSVDIDTFDGPLWISGLAASTPQAGTVLNFNVRTTMQGKAGTYFLETTVSTTVQACP